MPELQPRAAIVRPRSDVVVQESAMVDVLVPRVLQRPVGGVEVLTALNLN